MIRLARTVPFVATSALPGVPKDAASHFMAKPEPIARRKPRFRERNALKQQPAPVLQPPAPPPPRPRVARRIDIRPLPVALPRLTAESALYALLLIGGFTLRIWDVGSRAMHGDEAVHAWMAWNLYNGTGYQYDPVYHGPLQFIVTPVFFFLFGVSEISGRLMAVLFGTALIITPYFLRRQMGRPAALIASSYITISPAFVYVSRLERDDIFTCFFAMTMAIAIFSFLRTRQARYLYLGTASAALSLAAMENTYITLFIFVTVLLLMLGGEYVSRRGPGGRVEAVWKRTGSRHQIALPVLLGVASVLLAAFVLTVVTGLYLPVPLVLGIALILLVMRQSAFNSWSDERAPGMHALQSVTRQQCFNVATIVVAILILTYSTLGTNLRGIWDFTQPFFNTASACPDNPFPLNPCRRDIIGGLFYWLSQHEVHRGGQPWFYYTFLFALYEQIAVIMGVGGIIWFMRRPTMFTAFLTYWAVLSFGIYSWAGEKFPWLMIHPLLPITLLAAMFTAELLQRSHRIVWGLLVALSLLALLELNNMYRVNYLNGADPVEMMVYVQSSPDTPKVASDIQSISNKLTNGNDLAVSIDSLDTWPFAWYLRDMPHVAYPGYPELLQKEFTSNPVIVVDESHQPELDPKVRKSYTGHRYRLRWWFPEDYKDLTWKQFFLHLVDPGYWNVVSQWMINRRPFGPTGAVWFYYYVKNGLVSPF